MSSHRRILSLLFGTALAGLGAVFVVGGGTSESKAKGDLWGLQSEEAKQVRKEERRG